ncbi:MAG: hypothetical protein DWG80_05890 [Chloroflexi bacterium]|nr:hypothetical protein [Chloroflexota bacterium]
MSIYLASRQVPGLRAFVEDYAIGRRTCLVPIAAEPLDEGDAEVAAAVAAVRAADLEVEFVAQANGDGDAPPPLTDFHVIVLGPGDPFYLLGRLRDLGLDLELREAASRGSVIVGIGAGAVVLGPALDPWIVASEFAPEDGMYLDGLHLTETVILPHHNDPAHAESHAAIIARYGDSYPVVPLADDEAIIVSSDGTRRIRPALTV